MRVREQVSHDHPDAEHIVQFFDSDETRQEAVADFVAKAYSGSSAIILIARPLNSRAVLAHLAKTIPSVQADVESGRITVLDAPDILNRISRAGGPDPGRFENVVGGLVARLATTGRIYAYGEMVDILAQRGDFDQAVRLERLWNRLLLRAPIALMCGYSAAHFVSAGTEGALRDICAAHSDVVVEAQDPLASWLIEQAQ